MPIFVYQWITSSPLPQLVPQMQWSCWPFPKILVRLAVQLLYSLSIIKINQYYASLKLFKVTCHNGHGHWCRLLKHTWYLPLLDYWHFLFFAWCYIFSSAWLCQQNSWKRNLSVVCHPYQSSVRPCHSFLWSYYARISSKFWLLLPWAICSEFFLI